MELIRLLLLQQEQGESSAELESYSEEEVIYNYALMLDASLIDANLIEGGSGQLAGVTVHRLTWAGHDFLDATRDSKIWKMAKEQILKPGVSWTFSILSEWLKQEANKRIFKIPPSS